MEKFLTKINYSLGIEETRHDINVNSRILIVTGGNGCGKTSLLNQINSKIKTLCVEKKHSQISDIQRDIKYWEEQLNSFPRGNAQHQNAKNQLKYQRESLNSLEKGVTLEFKDINEISALLDEKKLFLTTSKLIGKPQY